MDEEVEKLKSRKQEAKIHSLEVDRRLLELDHQKVQESNGQRLKRKEIEENEGRNNLKLLEIKNKSHMEQKVRQNEEDKELVKRNLMHDMQKEANYNNVIEKYCIRFLIIVQFWRKMAENQFNLFQMHKNNFFEPEAQKVQKQEETILKNVDNYNKLREQKEFEKIMQKREVSNFIN